MLGNKHAKFRKAYDQFRAEQTMKVREHHTLPPKPAA
jgi:hypothetical protein